MNHATLLRSVPPEIGTTSAKECLENINNELSTCVGAEQLGRLASPQATVCNFCAYRPYCTAYKGRLAHSVYIHDRQWPNDIIGEVIEVRKLGAGTLAICMQQAGQAIWVRGVNPDHNRHPALSEMVVGTHAGIFNLRVPHNSGTPLEGAHTRRSTRT